MQRHVTIYTEYILPSIEIVQRYTVCQKETMFLQKTTITQTLFSYYIHIMRCAFCVYCAVGLHAVRARDVIHVESERAVCAHQPCHI